MKKLEEKITIGVINKIDLKAKIEREKIQKKFKRIVDISAKKMKNIELLEDAIANLVYDGKLRCSEAAMVSNLRHIESIKKAQKLIAEAVGSAGNNNLLPIEFIAQDIKDALGYLDDVLGKRFSEELLDKIFSEFCIGK